MLLIIVMFSPIFVIVRSRKGRLFLFFRTGPASVAIDAALHIINTDTITIIVGGHTAAPVRCSSSLKSSCWLHHLAHNSCTCTGFQLQKHSLYRISDSEFVFRLALNRCYAKTRSKWYQLIYCSSR